MMKPDSLATAAPDVAPPPPAIRPLGADEMRRAGGGYSVRMKDCLASSYSISGHG
jgi:hypothetical protein